MKKNDAVRSTYDAIGQLQTAQGFEADGVTPRLQEQFGYAYDKAWNLSERTNNSLVQNFTVNNVNELSTISRSGTLTVAGTTTEPGSKINVNGVTVSGTGLSSGPAALYADGTWARAGATPADGANTYNAVATDTYGRSSQDSVTVNLPASANYTSDLNGNLTSDGNRNFAYDDENQLVSVWVANSWSNSFAYDGLLRKRTERNYAWNGSSWVKTNEVRYVYDGNLVVQERDGNNLPQVTYTRGNDLSGTLQDAGGIGGLLARTDNSRPLVNDPFASAYYFSDAQGNIVAMTYTNGLLAAKYEYEPYGNIIAMSGPLANVNKYRFSSKEWEENPRMYYYGYRFYDPNLQRWPNRDPIGENGGINLYEFAFNNPSGYADLLGWCATFAFTDGSTQTGCTAEQLESIANNAAPNSIKNITVTGHSSLDNSGGANGQFLDYNLNGGELTQGRNGIVVFDPSTANQPDPKPDPTLVSLLNGKLAPGATITLNGCDTGVPSDPNNIASAISKEFPNVPVTGQNNPYHYVPYVHVHVPYPGDSTTTYVNGCSQ